MHTSLSKRFVHSLALLVVDILLFAGINAVAQESGHTRDVLAIDFSPDGKLLATASEDGTVKLWVWPELNPVATLGDGRSSITSVRFSPDGTRLATSDIEETVHLWDVATRRQLHVLAGIYSRGKMAFSPNGDLLAIGSGRDNAVLVVDGRDLTKRYEFLPGGDRLNGGYVGAMAFSPDGKSIAAAGYRESIIHLFDAATGKQIWESPPPPSRGRYAVNAATFSRDGSLLAVAAGGGCDANGEATLWRMPAGDLAGRLLIREMHRWVNSVDISPDGRLVVGGIDDGTVRLWEVSSLSLALTLNGAAGDVHVAAFSRDGKSIAASSGKTVVKWDLTEN